jgi:hypothetical protein
MKKIKIVVYNGNTRVYIDNIEVPLRRLPDLTPLFINNVLVKNGVLVMEGEAWYGINDTTFNLEIDPTISQKNEEISIERFRSKTGNMEIVNRPTSIEVRFKYKNRWYTVKFNKPIKTNIVLNPHFLSIRALGRVADQEFLSFMMNELKDKELRNFIRRATRTTNT